VFAGDGAHGLDVLGILLGIGCMAVHWHIQRAPLL
jgi:hypothetical protein